VHAVDEQSEDEVEVEGREDPAAPSSTEVAVRDVAPLRVVPARRWPLAVTRLRRRVPQVLRHPATVASVSVAATVGTRLLVSGLREAGRQASLARPASGTAAGTTSGAGTAITVAGYVLHQVHVIHHHVVHVSIPDR
jgi:hypothetical protein